MNHLRRYYPFSRPKPYENSINFGDIFLNEETSIFLGNGYLKAVELEKKQQWIEVSIDKSIEKAFPEFFKEDNLMGKINLHNKTLHYFLNPSIIKYRVPIKKTEAVNHNTEYLYTINWLNKLSL